MGTEFSLKEKTLEIISLILIAMVAALGVYLLITVMDNKVELAIIRTRLEELTKDVDKNTYRIGSIDASVRRIENQNTKILTKLEYIEKGIE